MTIEFRLDRSDHRVAEAFLDKRPEHVAAILIEAHNLSRQADAIASAKANRVDVVVETLTERLAYLGLDLGDLTTATESRLGRRISTPRQREPNT